MCANSTGREMTIPSRGGGTGGWTEQEVKEIKEMKEMKEGKVRRHRDVTNEGWRNEWMNE